MHVSKTSLLGETNSPNLVVYVHAPTCALNLQAYPCLIYGHSRLVLYYFWYNILPCVLILLTQPPCHHCSSSPYALSVAVYLPHFPWLRQFGLCSFQVSVVLLLVLYSIIADVFTNPISTSCPLCDPFPSHAPIVVHPLNTH